MKQRGTDTRPWRYVWTLLVFLGALFLAGCAVHSVKSHAFAQLDRLENEFKRGVSTKADVLAVLGEPDGSGGALFPTSAHWSDVWYYEASHGSVSSVDQNILLVYFRGEVFDGFMWFSNKADVSMR